MNSVIITAWLYDVLPSPATEPLKRTNGLVLHHKAPKRQRRQPLVIVDSTNIPRRSPAKKNNSNQYEDEGSANPGEAGVATPRRRTTRRPPGVNSAGSPVRRSIRTTRSTATRDKKNPLADVAGNIDAQNEPRDKATFPDPQAVPRLVKLPNRLVLISTANSTYSKALADSCDPVLWSSGVPSLPPSSKSSVSKRSSSPSKRSASPVKRVTQLQDVGRGISFQSLGGNLDYLGVSGRKLYNTMRDFDDKVQIVPTGICAVVQRVAPETRIRSFQQDDQDPRSPNELHDGWNRYGGSTSILGVASGT